LTTIDGLDTSYRRSDELKDENKIV